MSLASLATHTLDFTRKTTTRGTAGAHSETFASLYDDVRGSLQPIGGGLAQRFDRMSIQVTHVFYTDTALSLRSGDRADDGTNKYIVQMSEDQAGRSRVYAAFLLRTD